MPSHNCIIIDSMFSFQGTSLSFQENQWSFGSPELQSISWWRLAGSNRWPPACKAGALPAELNPHIPFVEVVGQNGLEPSTSRLSVVCSSQLSYWPMSSKSNPHCSHWPLRAQRSTVSLFLLSPPNPLRWALPGSPFHFLGTFLMYPLNWITQIRSNTLYWP